VAASFVTPEPQGPVRARGCHDVEASVAIDVRECDSVQRFGRAEHVRMPVADKGDRDEAAATFALESDCANQALGPTVVARFRRRRGNGEEHAYETDEQPPELHTPR